jgi:hypothetical protein
LIQQRLKELLYWMLLVGLSLQTEVVVAEGPKEE